MKEGFIWFGLVRLAFHQISTRRCLLLSPHMEQPRLKFPLTQEDDPQAQSRLLDFLSQQQGRWTHEQRSVPRSSARINVLSKETNIQDLALHFSFPVSTQGLSFYLLPLINKTLQFECTERSYVPAGLQVRLRNTSGAREVVITPKICFLVRMTVTPFTRGTTNKAPVSHLFVYLSFLFPKKRRMVKKWGWGRWKAMPPEQKEMEPRENTGKEEMNSKSFSN